MAKRIIHTEAAPKAIGTYSQAVRCGNTVYLAGQIGLDPATMELVAGIGPQIAARVREPAGGRAAAGGGLGDVVKLTVYLTDLDNFARVQRDHGDLLRRALSGARRGRRREPAARRAGGGRTPSCISSDE